MTSCGCHCQQCQITDEERRDAARWRELVGSVGMPRPLGYVRAMMPLEVRSFYGKNAKPISEPEYAEIPAYEFVLRSYGHLKLADAIDANIRRKIISGSGKFDPRLFLPERF